jgi:hypothetical protein
MNMQSPACIEIIKEVGISGKVEANERDKLMLANGGKFELYPDVKPRKSTFLLLLTIQVFNPGLSRMFYIYLLRKIAKKAALQHRINAL